MATFLLLMVFFVQLDRVLGAGGQGEVRAGKLLQKEDTSGPVDVAVKVAHSTIDPLCAAAFYSSSKLIFWGLGICRL